MDGTVTGTKRPPYCTGYNERFVILSGLGSDNVTIWHK